MKLSRVVKRYGDERTCTIEEREGYSNIMYHRRGLMTLLKAPRERVGLLIVLIFEKLKEFESYYYSLSLVISLMKKTVQGFTTAQKKTLKKYFPVF